MSFEANNTPTMIFKILLIGDAGVGKTNIVERYINKKFEENSVSTIGVDLRDKTFDFDGDRVKVQIWDTAGDPKYRSLQDSYYKGAQGFMLVYDISNKKSFENLDKWYKAIKVDNKNSNNIKVILVGNKSDLGENRQVTEEEGKNKAKIFGFPYIETSSLNGQNIDEAFFLLVKEVYNNNKNEFTPDVKLSLEEKKEKIENKTKKNSCIC